MDCHRFRSLNTNKVVIYIQMQLVSVLWYQHVFYKYD